METQQEITEALLKLEVKLATIQTMIEQLTILTKEINDDNN